MKGERKNVIARTEGTKQSILHFSLFILSFFIITACTDYQEEFENAFGALEYVHESSDSTPDGSSDSGSGKSSSSIKEKSSSSAESSSAKELSSNSEKSSSSVKVSSSSTDKLSSAKESSSSAKSSSSVTDASSSSVKSSSSMGDSGEYTDVRNNYVYKYITHNGLKWMTENLKYPSDGRGLCYATVLGNCDRYGRLYTWNDAKDACPDEWRLPTKSEMEAYFKNPYPDLLEKIGYGGMGSNWGGYWRWDDNTGLNHSGAHGKDSVGYYWTGTNDNGKSYYFKLSADDPVFAYWEDDNLYSYVRCVWGKESTSVNVGSSSSAQSSSAIASSSSVVSSSSTTVSSSSIGKVKDRAGNEYPVVQIGEQYWMAENLNYKTENSYCYDDQESNCEIYGRLYTWDAAMTACPDGYRLPSQDDISILWDYANQMDGNSRPQDVLWVNGTWDARANNKTGFSAYPGGRWNGSYGQWLMRAYFWTSTEVDDNKYAHYLMMDDLNATVGPSWPKNYRLSVRCVKN